MTPLASRMLHLRAVGRVAALTLGVGLAACSVPAVAFTPFDGGPGDTGNGDTGNGDTATARITIRRGGDAPGSISAQGAELSCADTCSASVAVGTSITLVASPDTGAVFGGWSGGGCTGTSPTCALSVTADITVDARFDVAMFTVDISLLGSGGGTIRSTPAGLSCPGTCSMAVPYNTTLDLVASPAATSSFLGWGGACSGTDACSLVVTANTTASAAFGANNELIVTRDGNGSGTVSSDPSGIACGDDCTEFYDAGTIVVLAATPASGSTFAGWSGACTGTDPCQVTMSSAKSVKATFATLTTLLAVSSFNGHSIEIFPADASGNTPPLRKIAGPSTSLINPRGVAVVNDEMVVMDQGARAISVFAVTANGDAPPLRQIVGPATGLVFPTGVSVFGGEIYVGDQGGILAVFPLDANGNVAPTRTITGIGEPEEVVIVGDELYVTDAAGNRIVVFPVSASGAATPSRVIGGPATGLRTPIGLQVHNGEIIVVNLFGRIAVFPQTGNGNIAPLRSISGFNAGTQILQIAVFAGEIYVANQLSSSIDVFPLFASGDVVPVRRLTGNLTSIVGPAAVSVF